MPSGFQFLRSSTSVSGELKGSTINREGDNEKGNDKSLELTEVTRLLRRKDRFEDIMVT